MVGKIWFDFDVYAIAFKDNDILYIHAGWGVDLLYLSRKY